MGVARERAELAVRIGELRHSHSWSWTELGKRAGVHAKQVEGIEMGIRDPQFSTLVKLARALELHPMDELLVALPLAQSLIDVHPSESDPRRH
jgi:transcriptional regulator with XRE-family HTH domain